MKAREKIAEGLRICMGFIQLERAKPQPDWNRTLITDAQRTAEVLMAALERVKAQEGRP